MHIGVSLILHYETHSTPTSTYSPLLAGFFVLWALFSLFFLSINQIQFQNLQRKTGSTLQERRPNHKRQKKKLQVQKSR
jgi:hypothetical protein